MKIEKIEIQNFQSYFGKTEIEFSSGTNLILGSIAKGKSKLFDAFYWSLFGQIYITNDGWYLTDKFDTPTFVNDKAKVDCRVGSDVILSVKIYLNDLTNATTTTESCIIYRKIICTKNSENEWDMSRSEILIEYVEDHDDKLIDNQADAKYFIDKMFPVRIRNYMWFQGEALDQLIDFKNKATFEKAIEQVSYYPMYETLEDIVESAAKKIAKEKKRKEDKLHGDNNKYKRIRKSISDLEIKIRNEEKKKMELTKWLESSEELIDSTKKKLDGYTDFPPLHNKEKEIERKFQTVCDKIENLNSSQKVNFQEKWMIKGVSHLIDSASENLKKIDLELTGENSMSLETPEKAYLQKMVKAKKCLVCNSNSKESLSAIKKRIKDQEDHFSKLNEEKYLSRILNQLIHYPTMIRNSLTSIDKDMDSYYSEIKSKNKDKKKLREEGNKVKDEIDVLVRKYKINIGKAVDEHKTQTDKYGSLLRQIGQYRTSIQRIDASLKQLKLDKESKEEELGKLNLDEGEKIVESKWLKLIQEINKAITTTKENAFNDLIRNIEKRSNKYYHGITKHNKAIDGNIMITDSLDIERVQLLKNGNFKILPNPNTGNLTLIKMCILNSIISLNEEKSGVAYPFITDAPTSALDEDTSYAYLMSISETFKQSIIITKDISKEKIKDLKKNKNITSIYTLETEGPKNETFTTMNSYTQVNKKL